MPIDRQSYKALEIFWGYNFFDRYKDQRYLEVPTLVITGGQDPAFTNEMGEILAHHFHHSEHLHLVEATHVLMSEMPQIVNQAIATWLEKIKS